MGWASFAASGMGGLDGRVIGLFVIPGTVLGLFVHRPQRQRDRADQKHGTTWFNTVRIVGYDIRSTRWALVLLAARA